MNQMWAIHDTDGNPVPSIQLIAAAIQCLANDALNRMPMPLILMERELRSADLQRLADRLAAEVRGGAQ